MSAYYNEMDPFAAAWLRELIKAGHIVPGEVDERSIEDVVPTDLSGFTQCHFFAGIGVWSYALRCAGWPNDRPVWTGSCPCQPFSAAGKGSGFADKRHLWPALFHLISQCRPVTIFGEQVASRDGLAWFDLVSTDLESAGYACGAVDICAAGFGAPHIRQRLYWVAHTIGQRSNGRDHGDSARLCGKIQTEGRVPAYKLGNAVRAGLEEYAGDGDGKTGRQEQAGSASPADRSCRNVPTDGFWRGADWLFCRDRKWRPAESGTFPLAHGASSRVGRLRGYGNALVAPQAEAFIRAYMEINQGGMKKNDRIQFSDTVYCPG